MTEEEIKNIIEDEIVVDAYGDEEIYGGWHCYMTDMLEFPFQAVVPLKKRNGRTEEHTLEVVEDVTDGRHFKCQSYDVHVDYKGILMKVELADVKPIDASEETITAIAVWKYRKEKLFY